MPLLNISEYSTVEDVIKQFKFETGLNIKINNALNESVTVYKIWREKFKIPSFDIIAKYNLLKFPETIYNFKSYISIKNLKEELNAIFGLEIDLYKNENKIDDCIRLNEVLPYGFNEFDKNKLEILNNRLILIEKKLFEDYKEILNDLEIKYSSDTTVNGFDISFELSYYLNEDDPVWSDKVDNILLIQIESFSLNIKEDRFGLYDQENHKDIKNGNLPENHCWLFHTLYDHKEFDFKDMIRIGRIDIKKIVTIQKIFNYDNISSLAYDEIQINEQRLIDYSYIYKSLKPKIFFEGKTDIQIIKKAAKVLDEEDILNKYLIYQGAGASLLNHFWSNRTNISYLTDSPLILYYDSDLNKKQMNQNNILVKIMPGNSNTSIEKGIENLFNENIANKIPEDYVNIITIKGSEKNKTKREIRDSCKVKVANWICSNVNSKSDYEKFIAIFKELKEIYEIYYK